MPRAAATFSRTLAPFAVLAAIAGVAPFTLAQDPSFSLVGFPPGVTVSQVTALSADGLVAAGRSNFGSAFTWTAAGGRFDLVPTNRWATGISGDGLTIVGGANSSPSSAFAWTQAGGFRNIGVTNPLPGYQSSSAVDANFDGSIVVGNADNGVGSTPQAFRWTQAGGTQGLGAGTRANAISGDGTTIVGTLTNQPIAMRWTQAGGPQVLPSLGGSGDSHARAINFDGTLIVGNSGPTFRPTMWVNGSPIELLSAIPNSRLTPFGMDDDGDVVAGQVQNDVGQFFAGVWTQATGIIRLSDYLLANGVNIPAGMVLENCSAVSADGRTFAGWTNLSSPGGIQGFVATIPTPCPADLDNDGSLANGGTRDRAVTIDDLLFLLAAFESGNLAADLDNGSNTGTCDSAVTIDDLLYFLTHFEAGC